jgi:hypothetical protein
VLGSYGGFALYAAYTTSALLLARPLLRALGAKDGVLWGLLALLTYVMAFTLAFTFVDYAAPIFIVGAIVGGIGAGALWTGQSVYYTLNAKDYAHKAGHASQERTLVNFASIFGGIYLMLETACKSLATVIYASYRNSAGGGSDSGTWRYAVFGMYTASALCAVVLYRILVTQLYSHDEEDDMEIDDHSDPRPSPYPGDDKADIVLLPKTPWLALKNDILSVAKAIYGSRKLQLLVPFQLSFGFSAGFVSFYVNGVIVNHFIGDGYIGLLNSINTLSAVFCAGSIF